MIAVTIEPRAGTVIMFGGRGVGKRFLAGMWSRVTAPIAPQG